MKKYTFFVFIFLINQFSFAQYLKPLATLNFSVDKEDDIDILGFASMPQISKAYIVSADKTYLYLHNQEGKEIFKHTLAKDHIRWRVPVSFCYQNQFYFLEANNLSFISLGSLKKGNFILKNQDYFQTTVFSYENQDFVLMQNETNLDLYRLPSLHLEHTITRSGNGIGSISIAQDQLIYQSRKNELTAFSLKERGISWTLNTGRTSFMLLKFDDIISEVKVTPAQDKILITTLVGNLLMIDPNKGLPLEDADKFAGKGNNKGLLTGFDFTDIDLDGTQDIIGAAVDKNVYAIHGKNLSTMWSYKTSEECQRGLVLYDINQDKTPDALLVNSNSELYLIDGKTGKLLEKTYINEKKEKGRSYVWLADWNGNGVLDCIVETQNSVKIYEIQGTTVKPFQFVGTSNTYFTQIVDQENK